MQFTTALAAFTLITEKPPKPQHPAPHRGRPGGPTPSWAVRL